MKFYIGIDLGTTNSSVAYCSVDSESDRELKQYKVHQLVSEGLVDALDILPSNLYFPAEGEFSSEVLELPWGESAKFVIGEFAKRQASRAGYRVVHSAKSWLCQSGIDRKKGILPFQSGLEELISPFEATVAILSHIRDSWNYDVLAGLFGEEADESFEFENQKIVITVPASFDPAARDLTMEAAKELGLEKLRLLEEPQAALYSWLESRDSWRDELELGSKVLVCDVGGGTTDFSLISADDEEGNLQLQRIAVGNHILLGGDNMDLALMVHLQNKLKESGQTPDAKQLESLKAQAREAKEKILGGDVASQKLTLAGSGSSLFESSMEVELDASDLDKVVLDGFFSACSTTDKPKTRRLFGFRQAGLNYAQDASILKHLADFLSRQESGFEVPRYILFNGSMFRSEKLQNKVIDCLKSWAEETGNEQEIEVLSTADLPLAVSRGAGYYARVSEGDGIRIKAALAYSLYIGIEKSQMAIPGVEPEIGLICVAPMGLEEGSSVEYKEEPLYLVTGEQVQFRLFRSPFRHDEVGTAIDFNEEEFEEISTLEKTLKEGNKEEFIPVHLSTEVTEVGTMDLYCIAQDQPDQKWQLEFHVRDQ